MNQKQLLAQVRANQSAKLAEREAHTAKIDAIREVCLAERRDPSDAEAEQVRAALVARAAVDEELAIFADRVDELEAEVRSNEAAQAHARRADGPNSADHSPAFVRVSDHRPAAIDRAESFGRHEIVATHAARAASRDQAVIGQHGSLGQLIRAMTTTGGSAIVPTLWASDVIDRARNVSAVIKAGAQIVPMDAKTVQVGRLTGDPTASFRSEGSAITPSDPTFDNVTLNSNTMSALVVGSMEWFADADNADELVTNALAEAMATQLDLVALYGSITTGAGTINLPTPQNPRGILGTLNATAPSNVLGAATNGTAQTTGSFFNELLDVLYTPQDYNEKPNAMIYNSKIARLYAKAYDTTGQPLAWPADLTKVDRFVSNQLPTYTQGTMTSAADVFAGDFRQLLIGQRLDFTIQVLHERYADSGQIGIVATWRGDVGLARPRAFSVYRALKAA